MFEVFQEILETNCGQLVWACTADDVYTYACPGCMYTAIEDDECSVCGTKYIFPDSNKFYNS